VVLLRFNLQRSTDRERFDEMFNEIKTIFKSLRVLFFVCKTISFHFGSIDLLDRTVRIAYREVASRCLSRCAILVRMIRVNNIYIYCVYTFAYGSLNYFCRMLQEMRKNRKAITHTRRVRDYRLFFDYFFVFEYTIIIIIIMTSVRFTRDNNCRYVCVMTRVPYEGARKLSRRPSTTRVVFFLFWRRGLADRHINYQ